MNQPQRSKKVSTLKIVATLYFWPHCATPPHWSCSLAFAISQIKILDFSQSALALAWFSKSQLTRLLIPVSIAFEYIVN